MITCEQFGKTKCSGYYPHCKDTFDFFNTNFDHLFYLKYFEYIKNQI
jgi:hypothetical protein